MVDPQSSLNLFGETKSIEVIESKDSNAERQKRRAICEAVKKRKLSFVV